MKLHSDGNEQDLVTELRKSKNFIPELSLVAVKNEKISRDKTAKYHGLEFKNITELNWQKSRNGIKWKYKTKIYLKDNRQRNFIC